MLSLASTADVALSHAAAISAATCAAWALACASLAVAERADVESDTGETGGKLAIGEMTVSPSRCEESERGLRTCEGENKRGAREVLPTGLLIRATAPGVKVFKFETVLPR